LFASGNGSSRIGYGPLRKVSRYIDQALVPLPDRLESFNLLRMVALDQILSVDFLDTIDSDMPIELLRQEWQALDGANYQDQLLFLDWKFTLADNDLRKVTEMTNLAGVEVAYPLLDNEIVEFAASIPASVRMPSGRLRHFYKESVKSFLPAETLTKSKHGFGLPFGVWARTDPGLREITKDSLSDFRQRRILTASFLDKLERQHMEDHADFYGNMVWVIMMLELWMQAHDASV
jgi:asparagine synthase (glutamine-hydrolysing)